MTIAEPGIFGSDHEVASQHNFQPTRHRKAVHRSNNRERKRFEAIEHTCYPAEYRCRRCKAALAIVNLPQVAAGAEGPTCAGQDQRANVGVGIALQAIEQSVEIIDQRQVDAVQHLRPVQDNPEGGAALFNLYAGFDHGTL